MSAAARPSRCAVYTRKSTEHNLDLEFNSLHAQREACEAYIKSQMHEGWRLIPDRYDDGAFSGASLDRPDLQRLLADIRAGKIDTVVVYKVDRLTRSLTDFARLVELFDKHGVSFVSVTQAFNTTTSMGRLTLNVLLSFAQFEREVIGERVRDKIAASKRKGLFMGGNIPLGYVNRDKKLVVVPEEAERVRWIFQRCLELGSIGKLLEEMNRLGVRTKVQPLSNGRTRGGGPFGKGALAYLLRNRCYVGEIAHRGEIHPADHEPIIEKQVFDAVQAKLQENKIARKLKLRSSPHLLTGLLFDSAGNRMSPSHTVKKGVRYRYYVSQGLLQSRQAADLGEITRVSATDVEETVMGFLHQKVRVTADARDALESLVERIVVRQDGLEIHPVRAPSGPKADPAFAEVEILAWRPKVTRLEQGIAHTPSSPAGGDGRSRDMLLTAIATSRCWVGQLMEGVSISEIASSDGRSERQIRTLLNLAFMPPADLKAILDGYCPADTITNRARRVPLLWPQAV